MRELDPGTSPAPRPAHGDVPLARSVDIARRQRVYMIQMAIRLACFALVFVVPGWWKLAVLAGAVLLPFTAVLMANDADVRAPALDEEDPLAEGPRALPSQGSAAAPASRRVITVEEDGSVTVHDDEGDGDAEPPSGPASRGGQP